MAWKSVSCLILSLLILSHLIYIHTEGREIKQDESNIKIRNKFDKIYRNRELLVVHDIKVCNWIQGAMCQLNPEYGSALFHRETGKLLEAMLDEAECYALSHEVNCRSHHACQWVQNNNNNNNLIEEKFSYCHYKEMDEIVDICVNESMEKFSLTYMECRAWPEEMCGNGDNCDRIEYTEDEKGCGIQATSAIDQLLSAYGSAEVIQILTQIASELKNYGTSLIIEKESIKEGGRRRRLFQANVTNNTSTKLIIGNDELDGTGETSSSNDDSTIKSSITGTGNNASDSNSVTSSSSNSSSSSYSNNSGYDYEDYNSTLKNEEEYLGSRISEEEYTDKDLVNDDYYVISNQVSSSTGNDDDEDDSNSYHLNYTYHIDDEERKAFVEFVSAGLTLENPKELTLTDLSFQDRFDDIIGILDIFENSLTPEIKDTELLMNKYGEIASKLDQMRLNLDAFEEEKSKDWHSIEDIWWHLQIAIQDFWISTKEILEDLYIESLTKLIDIAKIENYNWLELSSKQTSKLDKFKSQFVNLYEKITGNKTFELDVDSNESDLTVREITNNMELSEIVLNTINMYFESIFPKLIDMDFAEHFQQNWVMLLYSRNSKWHDIKDFAFSNSIFGNKISQLVNQLIQIPSKNTSEEIKQIKDLCNLVDGMIFATMSGNYTISNLPAKLQSPGLENFQIGPETATLKNIEDARSQAMSKLDASETLNNLNSREITNELGRIIEAVILTLNAKIYYVETGFIRNIRNKNSEPAPAETGIMLILDSSVNLAHQWLIFNIEDDSVYKNEEIMEMVLGMAGCSVLGKSEDGNCKSLDHSTCESTDLKYWNKSDGLFGDIHTECRPPKLNQIDLITKILSDVPEENVTFLAPVVNELLDTQTYCARLNMEQCQKEDRCVKDQFDTNCKASPEYINYYIEESELVTFGTINEECENYMGLPICHNYRTRSLCEASPSCVWTYKTLETSSGYRNQGVCLTDWIDKLSHVQKAILNDDIMQKQEECNNIYKEKDCVILDAEITTFEDVDQIPKASYRINKWLAAAISLCVTILAVALVNIIYKAIKYHLKRQEERAHSQAKVKSKLVPSTPAAPRSRGDIGLSTSINNNNNKSCFSPYPTHQAAVIIHNASTPNNKFGPSTSENKFSTLMFGIGESTTSDAKSQTSNIKVMPNTTEMERNTSSTTNDISEITPISEIPDNLEIIGGRGLSGIGGAVDCINSDVDDDDVSWTTSSTGWTSSSSEDEEEIQN